MKIVVRTLKQEKFEFELDEQNTVDDLKILIAERFGHEKSWQTLIFSGTMLESGRTILSYKITEKDFVVLLVKKPRESVKEAPKVQIPQETKTPDVKPAVQPSVQPSVQPTAQPSVQPTIESTVVANALAIQSLMEMGFQGPQIEGALAANFGDVNGAIEFLTMGMPNPVESAGWGIYEDDFEDGDEDDGDGDEEMEGDDIEDDDDEFDNEEVPTAAELFDLLRNSPEINNLRVMARTNPDMLEQMLSQLPPEILDIISNNQEEFVRLLQEEPNVVVQQQENPAGDLQLSPDDQAVITNLVAMGFTQDRVMEAYILFDRDADMTANYLLNQSWGH